VQVTPEGLNIGKDPQNDICIDDPYVSAFHARLRMDGTRCIIEDLDSRNGTFIGEQKVMEAEVADGAHVRIGQAVVEVLREGESTTFTGGQLVGNSPSIEKLRQLMQRFANNDAPVLIQGETGTGKEVVARQVALLSNRSSKPFIALNCGALGRDLIESELFGHEKGAFTGAVAKRAGAFEAASGGTLFLDELGELPLELQPQLLRVLETGEVRRVGSSESFRVDVRLVAATHRRLENLVQHGTFREDLFHRLHVLPLQLEPLRNRLEDIDELAMHFLSGLAPEGETLTLNPDALLKLKQHPWPGNVRELRNVLQRAVLLRESNTLTDADISFPPSTLQSRVESVSATSTGRTLQEIEREAIAAELTRHNGSKTDAAHALGVSRSTIHRKIEEYGISI
jgi:DNA-binding NtrC family response regulator